MEASYYKNIEYLWAILERLNTEEKIELAARIMNSIRPDAPKKEDPEGWRKLYGAWAKGGESAEDLIKLMSSNS